MPTKAEIEAELNADERARIVRKFQDILREHEEFEASLRALEDEAGLPNFYRSKPLVERMAAVGMSAEAIEHVQTWLDAINTINRTGPNDLPDHVKRELAETASAELSALDQLDDIVRAQRGTPK
jgi:acyl-CoA reductase-like NAD-dependent aldehyde dehydrogenase